jgi:hypothetical protein
MKQVVNLFMNAKADPDLRSSILTEGTDAVIERAWAAQVEDGSVSYADMFATEAVSYAHKQW